MLSDACENMQDATASKWRPARWLGLCAAVIVACPTGLGADQDRTIALYNVHTKESIRITYKRGDRFLPGALKKLNWFLRDWRQNESTKIDPALIDLVYDIHSELGSKKPVHVISSYRSPKTNEMLRRTRGGQARRSQHLLGRAMDVRFPDIPVRRLRYSALLREQGGVGYYPTSATPFVHVDTGRVRHWPRMKRPELALLFPDGKTRHRPKRGGALTPEDAATARAKKPALARRIAAFHRNRYNGTLGSAPPVRVAAKAHSTPRLKKNPRIAWSASTHPARSSAGISATTPPPPRPTANSAVREAPDSRVTPSSVTGNRIAAASAPAAPAGSDRAPLPFKPVLASADPTDALRQLARLRTSEPNPRPFIGGKRAPRREPAARERDVTEWVTAPAYDEDHPEELFYRPFPVASVITTSPSVDDPALTKLTRPDVSKTLALITDNPDASRLPDMQPGLIAATATWSQRFSDWQMAERDAGTNLDDASPSAPRAALSHGKARRANSLARLSHLMK